MANFHIYKTAAFELEDIWLYSARTWGERQADKYIAQIYDCLQELADKEKHWRKPPRELCVPADIDHGIFFYHHGRHYIFFREFQNSDIGVISILHDAMNIPVRLAIDLEKIK